MKKYLLLLTSAALLLAGCAKELVSNGVSSRDGELTKVTFTASLDNGVATKAVADGDGAAANVNRCIMEIYYGEDLFARQIVKVTDKVATFTAQVVSNRTYTVAFWADKVDDASTETGRATDKYYTTNATGGLQAITINGNYVGNDDARDAFAHCGTYTVAQAGSSWGNIKLKRPFAQINVITTDVATVAKVSSLKPEKVNLVLKNAVKTYNVLDSTAVAGSTGDLTYTANIYNWDANKTECTLSMDYIFAEKEKGAIDINWKAQKTGDADVEHAFAAVPYQRNYRTNIKGDLLTTTGQWTVTVDPDWDSQADGSKDYNVVYFAASSIEAANTYIGTQNAEQTKTVDLTNAKIKSTDVNADGTIHFILKKTSPKDLVSFRLPPIPSTLTGCTGWTIEYEEDYPTKNVEVSAPAGTNVIIQAPTSHVVLNGQTYGDIEARTGYGTLVVPQGVAINNLTVKKGWVEIHGTVNTLNDIVPAAGESVYFRDCEGLSQTVFAKIKDDGFNFIHPDYVEKENEQNGWDIIPVAIPVTSVSLNLDKVALNVDENKSLTATVLPEAASNKSVVWTSSNTDVATVDQEGKVTAVAAGSATITVTTVNKSKTATCSVTVGTLGGEFSVSATKKVHFSQGNLQATYNGSSYTWGFAANQYDYVGNAAGNTTIVSQTSGAVVDLFGWVGASSTQFTSSPEIYGVSTSNTSSHYGNVANEALKADWGKAIGDGNTWRTLSKDEWKYLFNTTSRMVNSKPCYSNAVSGVTIGSATYKGVFLYPDNYNGEVVSSGSMTWDQINAAGIVFLPAAGYRVGSVVYYVDDYGYYWSSTASVSNCAYGVYFNSVDVTPDRNDERIIGCSVRLITECQ